MTTDIHSFLHYGFVPRLEESFRERPWARVGADDIAAVDAVSRTALVEEGGRLLRKVCADADAGLHVVPLSGGYDSRFILATLLAAGARERIVAVTFGVPGTLDYDVARLVARTAGVRHETIDLSDRVVTREELLRTAHDAPWTILFEVFFNTLVQHRFGKDATYWSGVMANSMAGVDLRVATRDWASARREFADHCRVVKTESLTPTSFDAESVLPKAPILEDSALTHFEQLFAFLRYPGRNDPAMVPAGYDVRTPFRSPAWVDFMLRVPREIRSDQNFYREIATRSDPVLFGLPMKSSLGLSPSATPLQFQLRRVRFKAGRTLKARLPRVFTRVNPKLNYADFDREIREGTGVGVVIADSLERLASSGPVDWLDPLALLREHRRGYANHGNALMMLACLELNLAARSAGLAQPRRG